MKLALFDDFIPGLVRGDRVIDVRDVIGAIAEAPPAERLPSLIANFERLRPALEQVGERAGVPLMEVRLRPPLPPPRRSSAASATTERVWKHRCSPSICFSNHPTR